MMRQSPKPCIGVQGEANPIKSPVNPSIYRRVHLIQRR
jgi:hypothetical protein